MKFIGMGCALVALGDNIVEQAKEGCICAECWFGFLTLYRNMKKYGAPDRQFWKGNKNWKGVDYAKKVGEAYERKINENYNKRGEWVGKK